jgi:FlaG/FlaF family flagellin (archaellin)
VILAAVIGTFVLGLGSEVQQTPSAQFTFEESGTNVDITHSGGDPINPENMEVTGAGVASDACSSHDGSSGTNQWNSVNSESEINAGSSCTVDPNSDGTIRVTWQSEDGSASDELATYEHTEN